MIPKAGTIILIQMVKWTWSKFLKQLSSKETIRNMEKHVTDWDRVFQKHLSYKELIPKMYKELLQLNGK